MAATEAPGLPDEVIDLTREPITTYNQFYRSEHAEVYDGNYIGLMKAYTVAEGLQGDALAMERRELLSSVLQTRELLQAVIALLPDDNKLLLVHCIYYFSRPLGNNEVKDWEEKVMIGDKFPAEAEGN